MKVSVIVPVYNVERYIGRCLDSILGQTHRELEVIVVNDCTPDNSMVIVEEYAIKDSRIKIINQPDNKGLMCTRNVGVKVSAGDYIMFCDSDDWMPFDAVEVLLATALAQDADIVSGAFQSATSQSNHGLIRKPKLSYGNDPHSVYKSMLSNEFAHSLCGKIFKAGLLKDHEYLVKDNFTNSEDKLLMYQMVEYTNNVVAIGKVVYFYFVNEISSTKDKKKFANSSALNNVVFVTNMLIDKFKDDKELLLILKRNIVNTATSLAISKSINPMRYVSQLDLLDKENLLSINNLFKMYSGNLLLKTLIIINYYSLKK